MARIRNADGRVIIAGDTAFVEGGETAPSAKPQYRVTLWSARDIYKPVEMTVDGVAIIGSDVLSGAMGTKGCWVYVNPTAILAMTVEKLEAE